jgi:hypothetical protein
LSFFAIAHKSLGDIRVVVGPKDLLQRMKSPSALKWGEAPAGATKEERERERENDLRVWSCLHGDEICKSL